MKITTDTGKEIQFDPAFRVVVEKRERDNRQEGYFIIYDDVYDDVVSTRTNKVLVDILNGYYWFPVSQLEEVRGRLAALGLGLQIVEPND